MSLSNQMYRYMYKSLLYSSMYFHLHIGLVVLYTH